MTAAPATLPALAPWRAAVFVVFALNGMTMATWVARTPAIRDALEVRTDQFGLLILGMAIGSILGLLSSSHVIARIGTRRVILIGLITTSIGLALIGIGAQTVGSFAMVFVTLMFFGAATGITDVAMNLEGAGVEQRQGRSIMPWFHASWSFGTIIGASIAAGVADLGVGIDVHAAAMAVLLLVATLVVVRFLPREAVLAGLETENASGSTSTFRDRLAIWREPRILLIGLIVLGMAFAEGSANDWLALAVVDGRGVDEATGALAFGIFATAMTIGRIAGVWILDRFGRVPVLRGSAILAAAGLAVLITVDQPIIAAIGIFAWGLGSSLGFPVGMSAAADDPAKAAASVAAVATVGYFAFLVGPPVIGFLGEQIGLLNALWIVLVLILVAAIASGAARERGAAAGAGARASEPAPARASIDEDARP
ncbi:MFS transporter [Microcella flavibacter]|uniref:MFS transporter n=1 Tax=Microcella flavibacter TaxID=1804990 RepID=UPI001E37E6EC|nr:MFS transporter [Microcella flavibacter]